MTPRAWALASALAALGCDARTPIGSVWEGDPPDAVARPDAVAARDAGVTRRACDTFERDGVTLTRDASEPQTRVRVFYLDRDGALRFERRATDDARRLCDATLGAPDGAARVAARPAASRGRVVAAFVVGGDVALYTRAELESPGAICDPCGVCWSPWEPLPPLPAAPTGAPAVYAFAAPERDAIVTVAATDGELYYTTAEDHPGASWAAWRVVPGRPTNAFASGGVALTEWGRHVHAFVYVAEPGAPLRLHETVYDMDADAWIHLWLEHPSPREAPCSAPAARSLGLAGPQGSAELWLVITSAQGVCWARRYLDVGLQIPSWSPWVAVMGGEASDGFAAPSAPALDFGGQSRTPPNDLWLVGVRPEERRLQIARRAPKTGLFGPWSLAPDPLR